MQGGWGELIAHFPSLTKGGLLLLAACSTVADIGCLQHIFSLQACSSLAWKQAREVTQS